MVVLGCSSLQYIALPSSVIKVGSNSFSNCVKLESISLSAVLSLGLNAFFGCSNLKSMVVNSVATPFIWLQVFQGCDLLESVVIMPGGANTVGSQAFAGFAGLLRLEIREGITAIGLSKFITKSTFTY